MQLFRSGVQLPWLDRQRILRHTLRCQGPGGKVLELVPLSVAHEVKQHRNAINFKRSNMPLEDLKLELMRDPLSPMPAHMESKVGLESLEDIFARVVSSERDDILAYHLRT